MKDHYYTSLFRNNHAVMLIIDPESGSIIDANPAAAAYYGYSQGELQTKNIMDINMLSGEEIFLEMTRAKEERRRYFLFPHKLADGRIRQVEVCSGPITIDGKALLYSIVHDVTERIDIERASRERQKELYGLYRLNELTDRDMDPPERWNIFVSSVVPESVQFPEKTFCILILDEEKYSFREEDKTDNSIGEEIEINGSIRGSLTIGYTDEAIHFLSPFEKDLLHAYADKIGHFLTRTEGFLKLQSNEERFSQILNNIDASIIQLDGERKILWANTKAKELTPKIEKQYCFSAIPGQNEFCRGCTALGNRNSGRPMEKIEKVREGEENKYWAVTSIPLSVSKNQEPQFIEIIRDVTDKSAAEEKMKTMNRKLRDLSAYLETVREEERKRIAGEIHDELGQTLTAMKMNIYWIGKTVKDQTPKVREKLEETLQFIDSSVQSVQKIISELRPAVLDDLQISDAIRWEGEDFEKRTGITCTVTIDPEEITLEPKKATIIFRILREILTNVTRHAEAENVEITFQLLQGYIILKVKDDGKGISEEEIEGETSFGLIGIRERCLSCGGEIIISGAEGVGTIIEIVIPNLQRSGRHA